MEFDRSALIVGTHALVGGLFIAVAALGALDGAALGGIALRAVMGVLVIALGVYLGRTL
jgi:hypothetical protein